MQFFDDANFSWRILAVESLVIMLSVLLGFTLNGCRESAREQRTVDAALQSIAVELAHNEDQLSQRLPTYKATSDSLARLASGFTDKTPMGIDEIPGFQGFRVPVLRASAFEVAQSTGAISNMDFSLANDLFSLYRQQALYSDMISQLTNGLIRDDYETVGDWLRVYRLLANNGSTESYRELLNTLDEKRGIDVAALTPVDSLRAAR